MNRLHKILIFLGLVTVSLVGQTDYLSGMVAFAKDDYQAALSQWRPLAEQGQAEAQFNLGVLYDQGLGVRQNYTQAADWYQKAAMQGHPQAQYNLAVLYANGTGVAQNYVVALHWYRQAALQGLKEAQFNLAILYENGFGAVRDYTEAADWYRRAAEQGHIAAQNNLGVLYASGQGVAPNPANLAIAYAWYDVAATRGNAKARSNRDQLVQRLSAAQLAEGQRLATDYTQRYRPALP